MSERRHPSGYPVAHDAPAFVAPPLDLQRAIEAVREGSVEDAVAFTLAFPIVERTPVPRGLAFQVEIQEEGEGESTSPGMNEPPPLGHEPEMDTAVDLPRIDLPARIEPESERTLERDYYRDSGEITLQGSERDVLLHQLMSIGTFDVEADLEAERPSPARVLLGRARAIRFRLALLDVWPEDYSPSSTADEDLELMIHPAVVVAFADNAPVDPSTGLGAVDLELARAFAGVVRSQFPHITRGTLRETAAAAFARVTLLGTQRAVAYLHDRFREWPAHARRAALSLAADLAKGRASRDPRAIAMRMLDDALG